MRAICTWLVLLLVAAVPWAQDGRGGDEGGGGFSLEEFEQAVEDLELQGIRFPFSMVSGRLLPLFEGLEVTLEAFDGRRDVDAGTGLGLSYRFNKDLLKPLDLGSGKTGLAFSVEGSGLYAFDEEDNPDDLLETALRVSLFGRLSSERDTKRSKALRKTRAAMEFAGLTNAFAERTGDPDFGFEDFKRGPEWAEFLNKYPEGLGIGGSRVTWHADLQLGYETNQAFTSRQVVYGFEAGARYSNSEDGADWVNLFDYPFAAARWLTEGTFEPDGDSYPFVNLGIDRVEPDRNRAREAIGEPGGRGFERFRFESGMTSSLGELMGEPLKASLNYRYYDELDPSNAVRAADQDGFDYFAATLRLPGNFRLSYSSGRLPLDLVDDSTLTIGWSLNALPAEGIR